MAKVIIGMTSAVEWLQDIFNLDLSLVSHLGGHSQPRTHRGKEMFPGMVITYTLMEALEDIAEETPKRAKIIKKARVTKVLREGDKSVGVEYEYDGKKFTEYGPVVTLVLKCRNPHLTYLIELPSQSHRPAGQ